MVNLCIIWTQKRLPMDHIMPDTRTIIAVATQHLEDGRRLREEMRALLRRNNLSDSYQIDALRSSSLNQFTLCARYLDELLQQISANEFVALRAEVNGIRPVFDFYRTIAEANLMARNYAYALGYYKAFSVFYKLHLQQGGEPYPSDVKDRLMGGIRTCVYALNRAGTAAELPALFGHDLPSMREEAAAINASYSPYMAQTIFAPPADLAPDFSCLLRQTPPEFSLEELCSAYPLYEDSVYPTMG